MINEITFSEIFSLFSALNSTDCQDVWEAVHILGSPGSTTSLKKAADGVGGKFAVSRKESQHSHTALMVLRSAPTLGRFSLPNSPLSHFEPLATSEQEGAVGAH